MFIPAPAGVGTWQLYDLAADPGETNDLAVTHAARLAALLAAWERYVAETGVALERGRPVEATADPRRARGDTNAMSARPTVAGLAADLAAGHATSRALVEAALARIADPGETNDIAGTRAAQPATLLASWQR